jgi:outer membrane PBP1 activator LpoA protein
MMKAVFQSWPSTTRLVPVAVVVLALLGGCAGTGPRNNAQGLSAKQADNSYREGQYREAARAYANLAARSKTDRETLLVKAADAAWLAGDPGLARQLLGNITGRQLTGSERALSALLSVASTDSMPAHRSLVLLDGPDTEFPDRYRALLHRMRAEAFLDAGQPYRCARERIALADWLMDPDLAKENREAILSALQRLSGRQLTDRIARHRPDEEMYGWLVLVTLLKTQVFEGQPASLVIAGWRSRFPQHPANQDSIATLLEDYDLGFDKPDQVALLLPLSDERLKRAARAVRDGFFAAYYADQQHLAEVVVLDTGGDPQLALARYHQAIAGGATQIVGPLNKDAVTAVLLEADGSVPVLALNYQEGLAPTADNVFQFGLQPDEEARAAAERMLEDGHYRAVSLTPRSSWGDRMEHAFTERFQQLGGIVLGQYRYNDASVDYGAVVRESVGITEASLRERQLQRVLGEPLSFDAQRRHDNDAIFIAARPRQARQIKPQLAFYNAGNLPTYATSHVYSGHTDVDANRDLNGIQFCDAPWLLGAQSFQPSLERVRELFADARGSQVRLYAVGVDAYRILPYLSWLSRYRNDSFPGVTGQLSIDARDRIRRRLDCAVFQNGTAVYRASPLAEEAG